MNATRRQSLDSLVERSETYPGSYLVCDICGTCLEALLKRKAMATHARAKGWRVLTNSNLVYCHSCTEDYKTGIA